jgi:hypothetical protein
VSQQVFQWIVKPQISNKLNEMFLPGRTAFVFDMVSIHFQTKQMLLEIFFKCLNFTRNCFNFHLKGRCDALSINLSFLSLTALFLSFLRTSGMAPTSGTCGSYYADYVLYNIQDEEFSHDIPTTVQRSKADCPAPQVYSFC